MGSGGSVPLVAKLRDAYPDAALVLWGAQDSDLARIHAANESVDLGEIAKIALAEALLLQRAQPGLTAVLRATHQRVAAEARR